MGCASIKQTARTESTIGETNIVRTTTLTVRAVGDARNVIERLSSANTERAHILGAKGVEQDTTTTNLNSMVESIASGVARGVLSVRP